MSHGESFEVDVQFPRGWEVQTHVEADEVEMTIQFVFQIPRRSSFQTARELEDDVVVFLREAEVTSPTTPVI